MTQDNTWLQGNPEPMQKRTENRKMDNERSGRLPCPLHLRFPFTIHQYVMKDRINCPMSKSQLKLEAEPHPPTGSIRLHIPRKSNSSTNGVSSDQQQKATTRSSGLAERFPTPREVYVICPLTKQTRLSSSNRFSSTKASRY
jgi:hypothetical protein